MMEYSERVVNGALYRFVSVLVLDDEDRREIAKYKNCENVEIELSSLEYLSVFSVIYSLIITGGLPTAEGFEALYCHTELQRLVLDFEETDTDEEGIDLTKFPNLQYVLSRSNLNIRNYDPITCSEVKIEVLNYYRDGKAIKAPYYDGYDIFYKRSFWVFGVESYDPVGLIVSDMMLPIERAFTDSHFGERFSERLDSFKIMSICMPEGILNERRYISWKKRSADVRLHIPYYDFIQGDQAARIKLCKRNIQDAVGYVSMRDKSFAADRFLDAVWDAFYTVYRK